MPRAHCTFRRRDLRTAVETARAAGLDIGRVEIAPDGRIVLVAAGQQPDDDADLDRELQAFEAKHNDSTSPVEGRR